MCKVDLHTCMSMYACKCKFFSKITKIKMHKILAYKKNHGSINRIICKVFSMVSITACKMCERGRSSVNTVIL